MGVLLAALGGVLASFVAWLAQFFGRRAAIRLTVITVALGLIAGLITAIEAVVAGLSVAVPSPILIAASWVVPTNANECIAAAASARITKYIFDWNVSFLVAKGL